jgi:hypothetical protein
MDGKVQDLGEKEFETDREDCRRNLKLARQMLRFLAPGAVLRSLADRGAVQEEPLRLGRTEPVPCQTVAGNLPTFPLRQQAGDDAPVRAKVWVGNGGDQDGRLLALEVTPLDGAGKPMPGKGEFLAFSEYRLLGGRLVPMHIEHFAVDAAGKRATQMIVTLTTLELGAALQPADFDRPKR